MLSETQRKRQLGRFGEIVALETFIKRMGYRGRYLGHTHPCYDLELEDEDGQIFLAAVKTRCCTTHTGAIKRDGINLHYGKAGDRAEQIARSRNAVGVYVVVMVDPRRGSCTVLRGRIDDLRNKRVIDMKARSDPDKIIVEDEFDPRIIPEWSNVRKKR